MRTLKYLKDYLLTHSALDREKLQTYNSVDDLLVYATAVLSAQDVEILQNNLASFYQSGQLAKNAETGEFDPELPLPRADSLNDPEFIVPTTIYKT